MIKSSKKSQDDDAAAAAVAGEKSSVFSLFSKNRIFQALANYTKSSPAPTPPPKDPNDSSVSLTAKTVHVPHSKTHQPIKRHTSHEMLSQYVKNMERRESQEYEDRVAAKAAAKAALSKNRASNRFSALMHRRQSSAVVYKQGFLSKKTDFHHGSWKIYSVVLRGGKLYFYKPPSKHTFKGYLQEQQKAKRVTVSTTNPTQEAEKKYMSHAVGGTVLTDGMGLVGMRIRSNEIEPQLAELLLDGSELQRGYRYGVMCTEVDRHHFKFKRYCALMIVKDNVLICKRKFIANSTPNAELYPESTSAGSYTRWKLDTIVELQSVETLEANSTGFAAETPRDSLEKEEKPLPTPPQSPTAVLLDADINMNHGFQIFGRDALNGTPVTRLFVVKTREMKQEWIERVTDAKESLKRGVTLTGGKLNLSTERHADLKSSKSMGFEVICLDDAGDLVEGTADALIHELLFPTVAVEFTSVLLDCLTVYSSAGYLFDELIRYYRAHEPLRARITATFRLWIERCPSDFDYDMLKGLETLLMDETDDEAKEVVKLAEQCKFALIMRRQPPSNYPYGNSQALGIDLSNITVTGLTPSMFLRVNYDDLAQQIAIYHFRHASTLALQDVRSVIHPTDIITFHPFHFTYEQPHFLTSLVLKHIVQAGVATHVERRASVLIHWIHVAMHCLELGDAAGWMAIVMAICSPAISRLRDTWRSIPIMLLNVVNDEWMTELASCGLIATLHETMKPIVFTGDKHGPKSGFVPFLGGLKSWTDRCTSTVYKNDAKTVVDIQQLRYIQTAVSSALGTLLTSVQDRRRESTIVVEPILHEYFNQLETSMRDAPMSMRQWFEASLEIEYPIDSGYNQLHDRPKAFNSSWLIPLRFPALTSSRLFLSALHPQKYDQTTTRRKSMSELFRSAKGTRSPLAFMYEADAALEFHHLTKVDSDSLGKKTAAPLPSQVTAYTMDKDLMFRATLTHTNQDRQRLSVMAAEGIDIIARAQSSLQLEILGGTLERLAQIAVFGMPDAIQQELHDEQGRPLPTVYRAAKLVFNLAAYRTVFLSTYRSYCSPPVLLVLLEDFFAKTLDYVGGYSFAGSRQPSMISTTGSIESTPAPKMASLRSHAMAFCEAWWNEFIVDFYDNWDLHSLTLDFLQRLVTESTPDIQSRAVALQQAIYLTGFKPLAAASFSTFAQTTTSKAPDVDDYPLMDILTSLNDVLMSLVSQVTLTDWMLLYSILESRSIDPLSWYTRQKLDREDDVNLSSIFSLMDTCRVSESNVRLLSILPESIQKLFQCHGAIRNWVIDQVCGYELELSVRVHRIQLFLEMIAMCYKNRPMLAENVKIASFIERALSYGLVSTEARSFTRAWTEVGVVYNCPSIESLHDILSLVKAKKDEQLQLVPCVGWIAESLVDLFYREPDVLVDTHCLINHQKRDWAHQLFGLYGAYRDQGRIPTINVQTFLSTLLGSSENRLDTKKIKQVASHENSLSRATSATKAKTNRLFLRLIQEQMEKQKRDEKERQRIERELKDKQLMEMRLERQQVEKQTKKEEKGKKLLRMSGMVRKRSTTPEAVLLISEVVTTSKPSYVISLAGSAVNQVEHGKREHVFKLRTDQGALYLLQANSREDMLDWIKTIDVATKEATDKRTSIIESGQQVDEAVEEAPAPIKGRQSVFGVPLGESMMSDTIPTAIERLITHVELKGLDEVGIYRVPGMQSRIEKLMQQLNQDPTSVNLDDDEWGDVNIVACTLKQYFRQLPEPLLTYSLYDRFILAIQIEEYNDRLFALKDLLAELPRANYILLRRLMEHLERITDFEQVNKMYATNLAIVFGPTLLRPPPGPDNFMQSMSNLGHHQNIVKNMVLQYHWLFDIEKQEQEEEEEGEQEEQ